MNVVMISHESMARKAQPRLTVLMLLICAGLLVTMVDQLPKVMAPVSAHAIARHGEDADQAKRCLDGETRRGVIFYNPQSQRWALTCWLDGDRWGIVILTAGWLVITAFVTTKLKTRERMRRYMERQGYRET